MPTRIDNITVARALEIAVLDDCPPALWEEAEARLVKAELCPYCACDGERSKLMPWEPETEETYAGRECPVCENFIVCGQGNYSWSKPWEPETDASGNCYSDAVPGF